MVNVSCRAGLVTLVIMTVLAMSVFSRPIQNPSSPQNGRKILPAANVFAARYNKDKQLPKMNGTLHYTPQFEFLLNQYKSGIPHSYDVPDTYWRSSKYLPPHLHPQPIEGQVAIQDRVCTKYGLNLYDAATWEIGLNLQGEHEVPNSYEYNILYASTTGTDDQVGGLKDIRSDTSSFLFGKSQIPGSSLERVTLPANQTNPNDGTHTMPGAYFFRMISAFYITEDPLIGSYSTTFKYPYPFANGPSWNTYGVIIWNDWKPITGENVWGGIIGPIQGLWLQKNGTIESWANFAGTPPQVQLSLSILPSIMALQSVMGSLYHCPQGTDMWPPDPDEAQNVSNENNFSGYAAVTLLLGLLQNNTNTSNSDLSSAMQDLQSLQQGLQTWFEQNALAPPLNGTGARIFYQGGHVNFTGGFYPAPIDSDGGFAVDCQTWGSAVLGADFIDNQIAGVVGTAYNMWQQTKKWAGHYASDGSLAGVGYTVDPLHVIWSAEWSWGAVLATRDLSYQYSQMGCSNCAQYSQDLMNDSLSMTKNLQRLVKDGGMIADNGGYLYCNHRYFIPWGWYANPLPSLCSTSWSIMNDHYFNPFVLGGGPLATFY